MEATSKVVPAVLLLAALTGCTHETHVTVKDPSRVGAGAHDKDGVYVEVPGDGRAGTASAVLPPPMGYALGGSEQRLTITRDEDGAMGFEAPDTVGSEQGSLVTAQGAMVLPFSVLGATDAWRSKGELHARYMVQYEARGYHDHLIPSFEILLHTPTSNVEHAEVHRTPIRAFGGICLALGGILTVATVAALLSRNDATRTAGGAILGGLGLAFATGGTLFLALPATTSPVD